MDIVQLIYRPYEPQGASKDYEFSRSTMNTRWDQGKLDASTTLRAAPWLAPKPAEVGVRVFDVMHDLLLAENRAKAEQSPASNGLVNAQRTNGSSTDSALVKEKTTCDAPTTGSHPE